MSSTAAALAAQYNRAKYTYENSQLGPKTDRAWQRMETIMERAERLGLAAEFAKELGY